MGRRIHPNPRTPLVARLWAKITKAGPDDCWPWTGYVDRKGRGRIFDPERKSMMLVYRAAYEDVVGPIPPGAIIMHSCDNPPCCNPAHLRSATHAANNDDMHAKGRWHSDDRRGAKNSRAKLTDAMVLAIRAAPGRYDDIAKAYGIGHTTVSDIKNRNTWTHLPEREE